MSLFHLYAAYGIVQAQVLRAIHVGFVLFLTFSLFPAAPRFRDRIMAFDVVLALLSVAAIVYMLVDFDDFIYRAVTPTRWDLFFGTALILLILEALRRTSGWIMLGVVVAIVGFMLAGYTAIAAVFWATIIAFVLSFLRKECALYPGKLLGALNAGSVGVLAVAVTCAAAGLIVGVVTLTGLGLKFSAIIIKYAGNSVLLTAVYSGLIVWIIGLAVPVTASYIICAVIVAPALTNLGVPDFAAHMFIFYYAVLSEVSPPTALSPFAAAAITGGNPYKTTLQSWKYTLPAFIFPFTFVVDPAGVGILLKGPWMAVVWTSLTAAIGIVALAGGVQGWLFKKTALAERVLLAVSCPASGILPPEDDLLPGGRFGKRVGKRSGEDDPFHRCVTLCVFGITHPQRRYQPAEIRQMTLFLPA